MPAATRASSCSGANGFSRKSTAPSRIACTAVCTSPWAEIMIIGRVWPRLRQLRLQLETAHARHVEIADHAGRTDRRGRRPGRRSHRRMSARASRPLRAPSRGTRGPLRHRRRRGPFRARRAPSGLTATHASLVSPDLPGRNGSAATACLSRSADAISIEGPSSRAFTHYLPGHLLCRRPAATAGAPRPPASTAPRC